MPVALGAAPVMPSHAHNLRTVLAQRGFRRLLGIRLLSQIADGWFQAGLAGSVLFNPERNAGAFAVAMGFAVLLLPYSIVGPYVGVFLDRWSRRSILSVTNLLRTVLMLVTVMLLWHGAQDRVFLVVALLIIGLNRLFLAGLSAATPHVVDDERLVTANALAGTLGSVSYSLALGSAIVALKVGVPATFHGYAAVAALAPLGYLSSALLARFSFGCDALGPDACRRLPDRVLSSIREVGAGMVAGLRHLVRRRGAAYLVAAQSTFRVLYGVLALATLLLYQDRVSDSGDVTGSAAGLGMVFAGGGAGVLVAAFVTPPVARRIGGWRWVTILLASVGLVVLLFGTRLDQSSLVVAVFFVNVAAQGLKIVVDTSLQHECDDVFRGRVFSVNDTLFNTCYVVGLFAGAAVLPSDGRSFGALVLVALGYAVLAAWYAVVGGRWAMRVGDDIAQGEERAAASPAAPAN